MMPDRPRNPGSQLPDVINALNKLAEDLDVKSVSYESKRRFASVMVKVGGCLVIGGCLTKTGAFLLQIACMRGLSPTLFCVGIGVSVFSAVAHLCTAVAESAEVAQYLKLAYRKLDCNHSLYLSGQKCGFSITDVLSPTKAMIERSGLKRALQMKHPTAADGNGHIRYIVKQLERLERRED